MSGGAAKCGICSNPEPHGHDVTAELRFVSPAYFDEVVAKLRAENERLRAALTAIAKEPALSLGPFGDRNRMRATARAALDAQRDGSDEEGKK